MDMADAPHTSRREVRGGWGAGNCEDGKPLERAVELELLSMTWQEIVRKSAQASIPVDIGGRVALVVAVLNALSPCTRRGVVPAGFSCGPQPKKDGLGGWVGKERERESVKELPMLRKTGP